MIELTVKDMTCGHCVSTVTKALQAVDPQARVEVDLPSKRVRVETQQPVETLTQALQQAGFPAS